VFNRTGLFNENNVSCLEIRKMSELLFNLVPAVAGTTLGTPVADANAGGSVTDAVNLEKYHTAMFVLQFGARTGTTAAPVITAQSCSAADGTGATAMAFEYKLVNATDTNTDWTAVAASGLTPATADNYAIVVRIINENLTDGHEFARLSLTEPANDPQVMGCLVIMKDCRYDAGVMPSAKA